MIQLFIKMHEDGEEETLATFEADMLISTVMHEEDTEVCVDHMVDILYYRLDDEAGDEEERAMETEQLVNILWEVKEGSTVMYQEHA
tara:strand:+ start:927 stop:1187 length:261 start_codon:yes stop_codon:yes gene_type:complete